MKKILKELKSQNISYYMLLINAVVMLIIIILGSYLYRFYYDTIYTDFRVANEEHLSSEMLRHENDMQIVQNIVYQMSISEEVSRVRLTEDPSKAVKLERHLRQYTTVSKFFRQLFYQYHADDYLYCHTTSVGLEYFLNGGCRMELLDAESLRKEILSEEKEMRIFPEQKLIGSWIRPYMDGSRTVIIMQAIPTGYHETLIFMVPDTYYDSLMKNEVEDMRSDFIIYDDKIIVSRGTLDIDGSAVLQMTERTDGQKKVEMDDEKYLMSVMRGESGLIYCSLQSMEVFNNKIVAGQWGIITLLLVCAFPTVFFLLVISRRVKLKVSKLNQMLNAEEGQNYNLGSIENGIQSLIEENEQKEIENQNNKKTMFVRKFVCGDFQYQEEVCAAGKEASIGADHSLYLVSLMGKRNEKDKNRLHMHMLEMIKQSIHIEGYGMQLVNKNQSLFVLYADSEEHMEEILESLFSVGKESCEDFVMSVSSYHRDLTEGAEAYLEANTAYDNRFLQDNGKLLRFDGETSADAVSILPDSYLQELRYSLKMKDKEAVGQAVENICEKIKKETSSLLTFRLLCNDIIHVLISEWEGDKTGIEGIYNVFTLSQCLNIRDFNQLLCEVCNIIIENKVEMTGKELDIVKEAMLYMKNNFSNPELNMGMLAEHLHISSVTLAVEFKNYTGSRPSDYLTNLRMERAKELLLSSDMMIREISIEVGYEDDYVFTRRFKKYTGKTPGQYRDKNV